MKLAIALLAATVFALSSGLHAEEAPAAAAPTPGMSDHGRMMGGDTNAMMKMMGQMSGMMDQCNRMMQSMNDRPGPKSPDQSPK